MNAEVTNLDTAIIVASHDGSRDLWDPLLTLFQRNWPDCPFPIYLVCNSAEYQRSQITTLAVGPDRSWSDTVLAALRRIREEYVLLWIDDHFLSAPAKSAEIVAAIGAFKSINGNYLRLQSIPKPDAPYNESFGVVQKGSIYRTATVASVWKRQVLSDLLTPGQSAWELEIGGSVRSDAYDGFFSTWHDCFRIENLLIKGKISRRARRRVERSLGHSLKLERVMLSRAEEYRLLFQIIANRLLVKVPRHWARRIRAILKPSPAL